MSIERTRAAFNDASVLEQASLTGKRFERRCSTRPRFVESWRKTIKPEDGQLTDDDVLGSKLRVRVWVARTQALLQARSSHKILTNEDWSMLERLQTRPARDCAMAAKLLLRLGLTLTVERSIGPREWRFQTTLLGRPLISGSLASINFSISHTDALVAVAVSSQLGLGVDVESVDQDLTGNLIAGYCHAEEQKALQRLPPQRRAREFIRLWTQKEAYTKLLGCGHFMEFSSIECLAGSAHLKHGPGLNSAIHLENFYLPVDHCLYHASLAIDKSRSNPGPIDLQLISLGDPGGSIDAGPQ